MDCNDILNDVLIDFNDHALTADAAKEVSRHLSACPACSQRTRQLKRISSTLRASHTDIAIPKGIDRLIRDSIPGIIRANKAAKSIKTQQRFIRIAAVAAVVLIAFVGILSMFSQFSMHKSVTKPGKRIASRQPEPMSVVVQPPAPAVETIEAPVPLPAPAYAKGDVDKDGNLNIVDSMMICQYILKEREISDASNADVNGDGKVDIADSMLVAKMASTEGR